MIVNDGKKNHDQYYIYKNDGCFHSHGGTDFLSLDGLFHGKSQWKKMIKMDDLGVLAWIGNIHMYPHLKIKLYGSSQSEYQW